MTQATVKEVDGKLVLNDPVSLGVIRAVGKSNCRRTLELQEERVRHFAQRITDRGDSPQEVLIVLINVDESPELAELLMPGTDWSPMRTRGEVPFARGLASREFFQKLLEETDTQESSQKLRDITGIAVFVADHGVYEVFEVSR